MKLQERIMRMIAGLTVLFVLAGASGLFAQDASSGREVRKGFTLSAQVVQVSGMILPKDYYTYRSIGGANVPDSLYVGNTGPVSSQPGFGLALGYEWRIKALRMGAEVEGTFVSVADSTENLRDTVYYGATYTQVDTERDFNQSGRKLSLIDLSLFMGLFPFRSFALGFNVTAGVGYGRQSFASPAIADAVSRGFDANNLKNQTYFDFGSYEGNGSFARDSVVYFIGLGAEFDISRRLSLRIDYKYFASSYTRENVLISSGVVNVYQDKVSYEYTVANKFSAGLNFRI
jgi:hypothetical protein